MPVIPAKENAEILGLFTSGRVDEGFARLARFADLKQNDLPSLDKKAVAALGSSADAVRAFASGLFSGSASVRRMARKYAGKLGDAGAPAIALALAEAVRPLRKIGSPEEALLGSFGGFASPLGKTFDEVKPSTTIPQNGYSEAWRLAKEALETATAALGDGPLEWVVRAFEYTTALVRPFARLPAPPELAEAWPGQSAASLAGTIREALKEKIMALARKGDAALFSIVERWTRSELTLEDDARPGSPQALLRARFGELDQKDQHVGRMLARLSAADLLRYPLPLDVATKLYWLLKAAVREPATEDEKLLAMMLVGFERQHPRETAGMPPDPLPRLSTTEGRAAGVKKKAATAEAPAPSGAAPRVADEKPLLDPWSGTSREDGLDALIKVAAGLGLPEAWDRLRKDLADDWLDDEWRPKPGSAPLGAEATIDRAREGVKTLAREAPERKKLVKSLAEPAFNEDDGTFVSEDALDGAPWVDELGALVAAVPGAGARVIAALTLLPARVLEKHAAAFADGAAALSDEGRFAPHDSNRQGVARPWRAARARARAARATARTRTLGEKRGVDVRARGPLPERRSWPAGCCGSHPGCCAPVPGRDVPSPPLEPSVPLGLPARVGSEGRGVSRAAAFERLCVPAYFKGARAMVPDAERLAFDGTAVFEGSAPPGRELPLGDVFAFVAAGRAEIRPRDAREQRRVCGLREDRGDDSTAGGEAPGDARPRRAPRRRSRRGRRGPEGRAREAGTRHPRGDSGNLLEPGLDRVLRALERTASSASPGRHPKHGVASRRRCRRVPRTARRLRAAPRGAPLQRERPDARGRDEGAPSDRCFREGGGLGAVGEGPKPRARARRAGAEEARQARGGAPRVTGDVCGGRLRRAERSRGRRRGDVASPLSEPVPRSRVLAGAPG